MTDNISPSKLGLRERKKRQTRATIRNVALKLFIEKGYDSTTTSEIASAADVSIATLFNYFPSKESLLSDDFEPVFIHALQAQLTVKPLVPAFREAMQASMNKAATEMAFSFARSRLIRSTPALQAAAALERERDISRLSELLVEHYGPTIDEFEIRVSSAILVGAMHVAYEVWTAGDGKKDIHELVRRALAVIEAGVKHPANHGNNHSGSVRKRHKPQDGWPSKGGASKRLPK